MNTDMNLTLFESALPQEQTSQELFDYDFLPDDRRGFVLQKTAEIQWLLKRSSEDIIKIGKYLTEVKQELPHGMFGKWISAEFQMSHGSAGHFMNIANRLESKFLPGKNLDFGMSVLRELASPSTPEEIIDQVIVGDLPPTKEAIKQAKLEARLARESEAREKANAEAAQQELFTLQEISQEEINKLKEQYNEKVKKLAEQYNESIDKLKEDIQDLEANATPKIEIREVSKPVLPQSVKNTLVDLQNRIDELNASIEAEKKTIPQETQDALDKLNKQLDRLKEDRRLQDEADKANKEQIERLNSQLKVAIKDRITSENDERIRQEWRSITSEARSCLMRLLGSWPTSLDINSFESDDWERLSQLKTTLKRVLEECDALSYGSDHAEDDNTVELPVALIEAELFPMPVIDAKKPVIGIPPEYQALFDEYKQVALAHPQPTLLWQAHGYPLHMIEPEKHIQFTKELLSSEVDRRVKAAIEAMKRTLGTWEG